MVGCSESGEQEVKVVPPHLNELAKRHQEAPDDNAIGVPPPPS